MEIISPSPFLSNYKSQKILICKSSKLSVFREMPFLTHTVTKVDAKNLTSSQNLIYNLENAGQENVEKMSICWSEEERDFFSSSPQDDNLTAHITKQLFN